MLIRHYTFLFLLLTVSAGAYSQIVIHDSDLSAIGTSYTWGQVDEVNFLVGQAGPDQTWTFGNYEFDEIGITDIIAPQNGPHGQQFPTATRAVYNHTPDMPTHQAYSYFRVATEGQYYLGGEEMQYLTVLSDEVLSTPFPLQYQTAWTTVSSDTTEVIPGLTIISIDSTSSMVDGWGQVQTPFGNYACLRVFNHSHMYSYQNGSLIGSWEYISYAWINQAGNNIVLCGAPEGITDPNFSNGHIIMMNVPLDVEHNQAAISSGFTLGQNYPNPFNPNTTIEVNLDHPAPVELRVYNSLGQFVATLANEMYAAGSMRFSWNGLNQYGEPVAAGQYIYQLKAGIFVSSKKMILLR